MVFPFVLLKPVETHQRSASGMPVYARVSKPARFCRMPGPEKRMTMPREPSSGTPNGFGSRCAPGCSCDQTKFDGGTPVWRPC